MIEELEALSPVDNEKALAFAEKYDISVHSVRQKAIRSDNIVYQAKPNVRKDGSVKENKAEISAEIAKLCGEDAEDFSTLENSNRFVLIRVRAVLEAAAELALENEEIVR
jgi:hypothetical protein